MIGEGFAYVLSRFIAMLFVGAFIAGGLCVWGLPKLWAWIKPWIHQVTA
jgi:cell division FtsZ-interacting protein ZapD